MTVVAGIGEEPDEGDAVFDGREVEAMVGLSVENGLESPRDLEDPLVLVSETGGGGWVGFDEVLSSVCGERFPKLEE